jgi:GntR family transcriptional regulator
VSRKVNVDLVLSPDEPAAQQIVDHVSRMIALGVYRPGDDLPSASTLSEALGVTRTTVQQAYRSLEERGATSAVRGGPTTIMQSADTRQHFARRVFSDAIAVLRNLLPPLKRDEIRDAYEHEEGRHFRPRRAGSIDDEKPD